MCALSSTHFALFLGWNGLWHKYSGIGVCFVWKSWDARLWDLDVAANFSLASIISYKNPAILVFCPIVSARGICVVSTRNSENEDKPKMPCFSHGEQLGAPI
jgi:hypothetical protein